MNMSSLSSLFRYRALKPKFSCRAGENYRMSVGKLRSGNETGPIHDLSDFHYVGMPFIITFRNIAPYRHNRRFSSGAYQ